MTEETKNRLLEEAACLVSIANGKTVQRLSVVTGDWYGIPASQIDTPISDGLSTRLKPEPRILYGVYVDGVLQATAQIAVEDWDDTIEHLMKRFGEDSKIVKFVEEQ